MQTEPISKFTNEKKDKALERPNTVLERPNTVLERPILFYNVLILF